MKEGERNRCNLLFWCEGRKWDSMILSGYLGNGEGRRGLGGGSFPYAERKRMIIIY